MNLNREIYSKITGNSEEIITFFDGIPGFQYKKKFVFLYSEGKGPFIIMQSVEEERLAFITLNPWEVMGDYQFEINDLVKKRLGIESLEDILILAICNARGKLIDMTINLAAPIVINYKKRLGKQLVLDNSKYKVRYPVFQSSQNWGFKSACFKQKRR